MSIFQNPSSFNVSSSLPYVSHFSIGGKTRKRHGKRRKNKKSRNQKAGGIIKLPESIIVYEVKKI